MIALISLVLGIWLWDHYFGKPQGYAPDTEKIALIKIDRDLRLADAMSDDPAWLRKIAGSQSPPNAQNDALEVLKKLEAENALSTSGMEAYAVVKAIREKLPIRQLLSEVLPELDTTEYDHISKALAAHQGTWWHAKMVDSWEQNNQPSADWRNSFQQDNRQNKTRTIAARSIIWIIGIAGLFFIPHALACLKKGLSPKMSGYGKAWSLPLGITVFMVATLAWIGFNLALGIGFQAVPDLHPSISIFLDSASRLLPTFIALALLFKQPSHAIRVIGLNKPPSFKIVLGLFTLLIGVDQILLATIGSSNSVEPGGGLSLEDSGYWGLVFALVSACILAPIAEEILYRGVLFRAFMNRIGVIPGALASSAIFAILHFYNGYGLVSVALFGMSCAVVYSGTTSLTTVIALHMLYNSTIKIPQWIVYHAPLG